MIQLFLTLINYIKDSGDDVTKYNNFVSPKRLQFVVLYTLVVMKIDNSHWKMLIIIGLSFIVFFGYLTQTQRIGVVNYCFYNAVM